MASRGLRSHLSGSVPVSIVVHLVVLFVLVVIPLADIVLPIPLKPVDFYIIAAPLPPPPAAPVRSRVVPPTAASPTISTVPIHAPDTIGPEAPTTPPSQLGAVGEGISDGIGVDGAVGLVPAPLPPAPEPPRVPQGPVRVAQLPEAPRKIADAHPIYPEVARSARVQGTVVLEAVIDTAGRVTQLKVLTSVPLLDQAALDAVRQWRYSPSMYRGVPVSVLMTITVRFTLQQ
jgi:periplasmic protein TonB